MIINGKEIADEILAATRTRVAALSRKPCVRAVVVAPNAATESYLKIKSARAADAGMELEIVRLPDSATTEDVINAVGEEGADAVIVQLPLPSAIDTTKVLNAIPQEKDADVLSFAARDAYESMQDDVLFPPVAEAVREICMRAHIEVKDMHAVVIGLGWLVGAPVVKWLTFMEARVAVYTKEDDLAGKLKEADIIISGAGVPRLIQPDMIKPGVVLIDAGTSESDGALAGDADPACAEVASVFTPVPGGVGPIAVACLFRNVATLLMSSA
jgi:methylenetetrahydrofolate dehydrogenase (NADP+)/methenyltetrahydrofolate cyclohydrolase